MFRRTLAAAFILLAGISFVSTIFLMLTMISTDTYSPSTFVRALTWFAVAVSLSIFAAREIALYKQDKKEKE